MLDLFQTSWFYLLFILIFPSIYFILLYFIFLEITSVGLLLSINLFFFSSFSLFVFPISFVSFCFYWGYSKFLLLSLPFNQWKLWRSWFSRRGRGGTDVHTGSCMWGCGYRAADVDEQVKSIEVGYLSGFHLVSRWRAQTSIIFPDYFIRVEQTLCFVYKDRRSHNICSAKYKVVS